MRDQFIIARYQYIMSQKQKLNEVTFKIAALYQSLMIVVIGAQFYLLSRESSPGLPPQLAWFCSVTLIAVVIVITVFALVLLFGGILSWLKYRKDEAEIEWYAIGVSRGSPTAKDISRWYETYIILAILIVSALYVFVAVTLVLPRLSS